MIVYLSPFFYLIRNFQGTEGKLCDAKIVVCPLMYWESKRIMPDFLLCKPVEMYGSFLFPKESVLLVGTAERVICNHRKLHSVSRESRESYCILLVIFSIQPLLQNRHKIVWTCQDGKRISHSLVYCIWSTCVINLPFLLGGSKWWNTLTVLFSIRLDVRTFLWIFKVINFHISLLGLVAHRLIYWWYSLALILYHL